MLGQALQAMRDIVAKGGRVLFVGTKYQAKGKIEESAKRCGQYYVNHRWLGGMMTNWKTISKSINRLRETTDLIAKGDESGLKKKELLMIERERDKLELALGGIKDMGGQPDALFVIDVRQEDIAVAEANKLGIPVFGIIDTNVDPKGIDYPIPGNDDAIRAISLYCDMFAEAILDGLQAEMASAGKDSGAAAEPAPVKVAEPKAKADASKADVKAKEKPAEEASKAEKPAKAKKEEAPKKAASAG